MVTATTPTLAAPQRGTGTLTRDDLDTRYHDPNAGDSERFAHIVPAKDGKGASVLIMEARVMGTPIEALCGKRWIPQRDPSRFPVCPACIEIARTAKQRIAEGP